MAYISSKQSKSIFKNGYFIDTKENRKELIKRQNRALEGYKSKKEMKKKLKGKKPNYGYKKYYA